MSMMRDVRQHEQAMHIELGIDSSLPIVIGDQPARLQDGWSAVVAFVAFPSFLLLELRHDGGGRATWIVNRSGMRIAGNVAELTNPEREILRIEARLVIRSLLQHAIIGSQASAHEGLAEYFTLSPGIRGEIETLIGAMDLPVAEIDVRICADAARPGTELVIPACSIRHCLATNVQDRYLEACRTGRMCWPSPVDGAPVYEIHGLLLWPLAMAWRCVDRRHDLVFFVIVGGFDQETAGLYLPCIGLYVSLPKTRLTQTPFAASTIVGWVGEHLLAYGPTLLAFFKAPIQRFAQYTWPAASAHIGHYLWNEWSGLERIIDELEPQQYPLLYDLGGAGGAAFYGPLSHLFPELQHVIELRFSNLPDMLRNSYLHRIQVLRFSGTFVSAETRKRIANVAAGVPASESARRVLWKGSGPVIVFGLRVENRTLTNLAEFYITLAKRLAKRFVRLTIIIDGHNSRSAADKTATFDSHLEHRAKRRPVDVEIEAVAAIQEGLKGDPIEIVDCVGMTVLENIGWLLQAHYCVAPWGAGLAKYRWACNLPAYILVSRYCLLHKNDILIYDDPAYMECPTNLVLSPPEVVTDRPEAPVLLAMDPVHAAFYMNYEVDAEPVAAMVGDVIAAIGGAEQTWPRHRPHQDFQIEADVLIGKRGELFLANGGHHVLDHVLGYRMPLKSSVENFRANIAYRLKAAAAIQASYLHVIFPDKQSVLGEAFGEPDAVCLGEVYARHCCSVWDRVVYPLDALRASPDGLFLQTDTHMTHLGMLAVVELLLRRLFGPVSDALVEPLRTRISSSRPFTGDLGRKLDPQQQEPQSFLAANPGVRIFSNNLNTGNNGAVSIYVFADAPRGERVLIFGDSFGQGLGWILAQLFREVVFFRTPFMHPDLLASVLPDIVISEHVERYLGHVSRDAERPYFPMMNTMSHAEHPADRAFADAMSAICSFGRAPYRRLMDKLEFGSS